MRFVATWEQGDALSCHVCLMLSPPDWKELRAVHRLLSRRLDESEVRWLFAQRLKGRVEASIGLHCSPIPQEERCIGSIAPLLALASAVEAVAEVLEDVVAYPRLAGPDLLPVRQVLARLHQLTLKDQQLMPRERSGRRATLSRRLLRSFAAFNGLLPRLVSLITAFPVSTMPPGVFVIVCEVLASLVHNAKESKRTFMAAGGLKTLLDFLRGHPDDAEVQAAGLAALLALSARSVFCICLMADAGAHEVIAAALQRFPKDVKIVARATGLLANMSNVPCVCPKLQQCGVLALARRFLIDGEPRPGLAQESATPFVRDFVQYLLTNLQEHHDAS